MKRDRLEVGEDVGGLSAIELWVHLVMQVAHASVDVPTLAAWGNLTARSVSSVRQQCYAAHVAPRRALLFARLLRPVLQAHGGRWDLAEWLHAADPGTLAKIGRLGGLSATVEQAPSLSEFLMRQRLLSPDSGALRAIRAAIGVA